MKKLSAFVILFTFIALLCMGGVSASWTYTDNYVGSINSSFNVNIGDFVWQGSEILPDDEEEELSHNALLLKIVDNVEGLNNPNSLLSQAVKKRFEDNYDTVSSSQQVSGGNLRNVFSSIEGFQYVGFLIEYVNDEEYYIYTYDHRDTTDLKVSVDTYLTHLHLREGKWVLSGGFAGTAISCVYDGKTNGPYKNTINPDSFLRNEN